VLWICERTPVRSGLEHQFQTVDREAAAKAAGLPNEKVRIHTTFLGGGFGRRQLPQSDFVVEAVYVAKAAGVPVKVVWTREDDMQVRLVSTGVPPCHCRWR
jgi:CO/xanthine dehydrogenase Mo-binding subunit